MEIIIVIFFNLKLLDKLIFILFDGCPTNIGEGIGIFGYLKMICPLKIICVFNSENLALKHLYDPKSKYHIEELSDF